MSNLIPVAMSTAELVAVLDDVRARVADGDSFEGNINWVMPIDEGDLPAIWPSADCDFWVYGVYRIGNSQGQGGVRMIGDVPGMS